eukprot:11174372-Lingulodinium_polyedra.AAC.1
MAPGKKQPAQTQRDLKTNAPATNLEWGGTPRATATATPSEANAANPGQAELACKPERAAGQQRPC